ncbi:MAG TPA: nucleotide exchange factor GrpE [Methylomirabilota bacterium]|jgi:molecular chaperone GrpE|nr:nucleotide exchange factor GrpE [Methylomirabilota bacterium]
MVEDRWGTPEEPSAAPRDADDVLAGEAASSTDGALEILRAQAEAKAREAAEAQDRYVRALADFDNYKKRIGRERDEWRRQAQEQIVREILPVLDNFDRALSAEPGSDGERGFRAGVELIHRDFLKALERVGVRPFSAVGEFFDPQRHEAVARVERSDVADQTIVKEVLRGYLFHDRVLRPAQVVVAVEPPPPPDRRGVHP